MAHIDDFDDKGASELLMGGEWQKINSANMADVVGGLANFIPGFGGLLASTGFTSAGAEQHEENKLRRLQAVLGLGDLKAIAARNPAIRKGLGNIGVETGGAIGSDAAGNVGALAGAALGSAAIPVVGPFIGMFGGSIGGSKFFDSVMGEKTENSLELVARIRLAQFMAISKAHKTGEPVHADIPEEVVLAAMIINLPDAARKEISKITGIENFSEAVANNDLGKLTLAMRNEKVDAIIRSQSGFEPYNPNDATMPLAREVAANINAGRTDANHLLLNAVDRMQIEANLASAPLRDQGVAPVGNDVPQEIPGGRGGSRVMV